MAALRCASAINSLSDVAERAARAEHAHVAALARRALRGVHASVPEVAAHDGGELRDGNFWLLDLRMPPLLPFEAEVARVAGVHERLHLPSHRHVPSAGENVAPIVARGHRVLEVRVPDPPSKLPHGILRRLSAGCEGVVRIPED